jgi:hypothetical protein
MLLISSPISCTDGCGTGGWCGGPESEEEIGNCTKRPSAEGRAASISVVWGLMHDGLGRCTWKDNHSVICESVKNVAPLLTMSCHRGFKEPSRCSEERDFGDFR